MWDLCKGKIKRLSFQTINKETKPSYIIHSDICNLKFTPTSDDNKYFITFVYDNTKYCYVYLLKSKGEAIEKFVLNKIEIKNQLNRKIKMIRSDHGDEYVTQIDELHMKSLHLIHLN